MFNTSVSSGKVAGLTPILKGSMFSIEWSSGDQLERYILNSRLRYGGMRFFHLR